MPHDDLPCIDTQQLNAVIGGSKTVAGDDSPQSDQIMMMLTSLASSIKELGAQKPTDQMMPMMMMMMMMGGGQKGAPPPAPAPQPAPAPPPGGGWTKVS